MKTPSDSLYSRFCQGWNHQGVLSDFQGWVSCGQDSIIQIPNPLWTQANQIFFSSHVDAVPLTAVTGLQRCRYGIEVVGAIFLAHFLRLNTSLTTFNFRRHWEGGTMAVHWVILPYWNLISTGISGFPGVDFKVPSWFSWGYSIGNVLETGWSYSMGSIKITLQAYINSA